MDEEKAQIRFGTKEELNKLREEEFLALPPEKRLWMFFQMVEQHNRLFGYQPNPNNFYLEKRKVD